MSNNGTAKRPSQPGSPEAPTEAPRRGRGRPRKPQQELSGPPTPKRPRGRPRGSKNKGPRATPKKTEPAGEKRPRGRPRKWTITRTLQTVTRTLQTAMEAASPRRGPPQKVIQEGQQQADPQGAMEGPSQTPPPAEGK